MMNLLRSGRRFSTAFMEWILAHALRPHFGGVPSSWTGTISRLASEWNDSTTLGSLLDDIERDRAIVRLRKVRVLPAWFGVPPVV